MNPLHQPDPSDWTRFTPLLRTAREAEKINRAAVANAAASKPQPFPKKPRQKLDSDPANP